MDIGKAIEAAFNAIPILQSYATWIRVLFCLWLLLGVAVVSAMLIVGPKKATDAQQQVDQTTQSEPHLWPTTGDPEIDRVHKRLNELSSSNTTEAGLTAILGNLFNRSVYLHIGEERTESALFAFCRTTRLLEYYNPFFTQSPSVRRQIGHARTRLIKLQQHVETLYGPTFSSELHCEKYGDNRALFIDKIPPLVNNPREEVYERKANQILGELQEALKQAGLMPGSELTTTPQVEVVVGWDRRHGMFLGDLHRDLMTAGLQVEIIESVLVTDLLDRYDVLILATDGAPSKVFEPSEIDLINRWVRSGNLLVCAGQAWHWVGGLNQPEEEFPLNILGSRLGFKVSGVNVGAPYHVVDPPVPDGILRRDGWWPSKVEILERGSGLIYDEGDNLIMAQIPAGRGLVIVAGAGGLLRDNPRFTVELLRSRLSIVRSPMRSPNRANAADLKASPPAVVKEATRPAIGQFRKETDHRLRALEKCIAKRWTVHQDLDGESPQTSALDPGFKRYSLDGLIAAGWDDETLKECTSSLDTLRELMPETARQKDELLLRGHQAIITIRRRLGL